MKLKKWELIVLLALIAGLALWALAPKASGAAVSVTVSGEKIGAYPLSVPGRYPLEGYGGYTLTLVVESGCAHVEDAACPDLICQNHAPVSRAGEQIICLPARIVIAVTGEEEEADAYIG